LQPFGFRGRSAGEIFLQKERIFPRAFYVAFMLHGAADSVLETLKMLGNFLQHMQHENGQRKPGQNARYVDQIRVSRVAGGLGFEPRLTESESAVQRDSPGHLRRMESALLSCLAFEIFPDVGTSYRIPRNVCTAAM
jgi:hypothetical protein